MDLSEVTVIAKKLLIKTAQCWLFYDSPTGFLEDFISFPADFRTIFSPDIRFDGIVFFAKNSTALKLGLTGIIPVLKSETLLWVAYPKKSSGIVSDLEMTRNWKELNEIGWQTVASAAIDKTWTALRFKPKEHVKSSGISNTAIQQNDLAAFINIENKIVTLPKDVRLALENEPKAFDVYQKLAYSHQKEYIIWILSAKQEKTRTSRVLKMVEKLSG